MAHSGAAQQPLKSIEDLVKEKEEARAGLKAALQAKESKSIIDGWTFLCQEAKDELDKAQAAVQPQAAQPQAAPVGAIVAHPPVTKRWCPMEVAEPDRDYYVWTQLVLLLAEACVAREKRHVLVMDIRQAGKTTAAMGLCNKLALGGVTAYYISLGDELHTSDVAQFWHDIHAALYSSALVTSEEERFAIPPNPGWHTFTSLWRSGPQRQRLIIDEGAKLCSLADNVLDSFLDAVRSLTSDVRPGACLEGVIIFGVYGVQYLLDEHNSRRRLKARRIGPAPDTNIARPSCSGTSTGITANQSMTGGGVLTAAITPSSSSRLFTGTSPFKPDDIYDTGRFSVEEMVDLLTQYVHDYRSLLPLWSVLREQDISDVAKDMLSQTWGLRGLTCLLGKLLRDRKICTLQAWLAFSGSSLVDAVLSSTAFRACISALRLVYPLARDEQRLQTAGGYDWEALQTQQQVMENVLLKGVHTGSADQLPHLQRLLEEGILVPAADAAEGGQPEAGLRGSSYALLAQADLEAVQLTLGCPLMRSCLLRRFSRVVEGVQPPPSVDQLGMMWLLKEVVACLDIDTLKLKESLTAKGTTAEYGFLSQVYLVCYSVLREYFNHLYTLIPEARNLDVEGYAQRRLDMLLRAKKEGVVQYGLELQAFGTRKQILEHHKRAELYSCLHATTINGTDTRCKMYAINFCEVVPGGGLLFPDAVDPDAGVVMVHVVLGTTDATMYFPGNVIVPVTYRQKSATGRVRMYRTSDPGSQ